MAKAQLCVCGHLKGHHHSRTLVCLMHMEQEDDLLIQCACKRFQLAADAPTPKETE